MWHGHLGRSNAANHRTDLFNDEMSMVHPALYRAGPATRQFAAAEASPVIAENFIEPVTAEWAALIVIYPRKNGSLRFSVYNRKLIVVTTYGLYTLSSMDECFDSLGEATALCTLDATDGYWQIKIDERYRGKTAFTSHYGLYMFTGMPLGLKSALSTNQKAMSVILVPVRWHFR